MPRGTQRFIFCLCPNDTMMPPAFPAVDGTPTRRSIFARKYTDAKKALPDPPRGYRWVPISATTQGD